MVKSLLVIVHFFFLSYLDPSHTQILYFIMISFLLKKQASVGIPGITFSICDENQIVLKKMSMTLKLLHQ